MRTVLLLGMAAGSLLLARHATGAERPITGAPSITPTASFGDHSAPRLDYGVAAGADTRVYTGYPDRVPSEVDYRGGGYPPPPGATFHGTYDAEGRWTGTWDGTYETPDGRRYDGRYEGTVEGRPGASYAPPPPDPYYSRGYDPRHDTEMERRCGHGGQVGGAVVGGIVGGIAGNRIAGKGNRTAGTLIGGGVGALAGAAIGDAEDRRKCEQWWASRESHHGGYYQGGYYQGGYGGYRHGYGYGYGYGYYSPGVVVTTIINGPPVVTETVETTTRTYYETVPVKKKRYVAKKKWKPKPKPRCVC